MHQPDQSFDGLIQPLAGDGQTSDPDVELAFRLQHGRSGDAQIQRLLVDRFAAELHRLVSGWIELDCGFSVAPGVIRGLLIEILRGATAQIEQFRGEESVRNWIYRLAVRQLKKYRKGKFKNGNPQLFEDGAILEQVYQLPRPSRTLLWLHYGIGISPPECAAILGEPVKKVGKRLHAARAKLLTGILPDTQEEACKACVHILLERSDGMLKHQGEAMAQFEEHLKQCSSCQGDANRLSLFEQSLISEMIQRWPLPILSEAALLELNAAIPIRPEKTSFPILATGWIKAGWTGLFILAFIAVGVFWMRMSGDESVPDGIDTPVDRELPELTHAAATSELVFPDPPNTQGIQYIAQDQSEDGNWVAYIVYEIHSGDTGDTYQERVFLYDTAANTSQKIYDSQSIPLAATETWFNPPGISADGTWITYSAPPSLSSQEGETCFTESGLLCLDIYVFNRHSAEIDRITQGWNGEPANGHSYSPAISSDGQVIGFWSSASNLIEEQDGTCDSDEQLRNCTFGYIYSLETQATSMLPEFGYQEVLPAEHMSLSADGSFIAFTTGIKDPDGGLLYVQSFIFDRNRGTLESINKTPDGIPGNGDAYGAVIDASGRYIAFISASSNLVSGDTNGFTDVFWRDRLTGALVLVSTGMAGEQADGNSGIPVPGFGSISLDISPDGQRIIYASAASNMVENPGTCEPGQQDMCYGLYLYDLRVDRTALIAPRRSDGYNYFPASTADGRWISYVGIHSDCQPTSNCSDLLRHDLLRGWTYDLNEEPIDLPGYLWRNYRNLSLPEVQTYALTFSDDGHYLASANSDIKVRIFDTSDPSDLIVLEGKNPSVIISLDFSTDATLLAGGSAGGDVYVWEVQTGSLLFAIGEIPGRVIDVFFSTGSEQLIVVTAGELSIWQVGEQTLTRIRHMEFEGPGILDADLSPAGNLLATARQDGTVWLQMLSNGLILARLSGSQVATGEVIFNMDGTRLASRAVDGTINLWQISWLGFGALDVTPLNSYSFPYWMGNLGILADGSSLATILSDGGVGIWNINNAQTFRISTPQIDRLAFVPSGDTLATASNEAIYLWNGPGLTDGSYFSRAETDILPQVDFLSGVSMADLQSGSWPSSLGQGSNLYRMDELWSNDLIAPAHLPEWIVLNGAYQLDDGNILLYYTIEKGTDETSDLFILEQQVIGEQIPMLNVGNSAEIYSPSWDDVQAEYVRGEWMPEGNLEGELAEPNWRWDNTATSERLSWQNGDILVAIVHVGSPSDLSIIGMDDMLQIAQGLQLVNPPPRVLDGSFEYIVRPGNTCSGIADRFGVEIETIVAMNQLDDGCDLIFAGQSIYIPIVNPGFEFYDADFDCDGMDERVEVRFVGKFGLWSSWLRVLVIGDSGFYQQAWDRMWGNFEIERIDRVAILQTESCGPYLAVEVDSDFHSPYWSIFSWTGSAMQPVEISPAELQRLLESNRVE
jgi:WD40 repeat protein/LysM repeat protein